MTGGGGWGRPNHARFIALLSRATGNGARCPSAAGRVASPLPGSADHLGAAGPGTGSHGGSHPATGSGVEHATDLAAQAVAGVECHGPVVARVETSGGCQSPARNRRSSRPTSRKLVTGTQSTGGFA